MRRFDPNPHRRLATPDGRTLAKFLLAAPAHVRENTEERPTPSCPSEEPPVPHDPSARTSATLLGRVTGPSADADAWREFSHRYQPVIRAWCRRRGLKDDAADDVTQNVFLALARQMQTFAYDPASSFRAWLSVVTRRACSEWCRQQRRQACGSGDTGVHLLLETEDAHDDIARMVEEEHNRDLLARATTAVEDQVEPPTWAAFRLTTMEGVPAGEAAARLGMTVSAVYMAKHHVKERLRKELERLDTRGEHVR